MIKSTQKQVKDTKEDILRKFEHIEYHKDVDIDRYVDVQMNEKIKGQLKDIDDQIEVLGKVCDKQYKSSYNLLKSILDKESEKIDNNIKDYIASLREHLLKFRNRLNFDYKGKFKQVSNKVNALVEQTKKNANLKESLENKQQVLNEDNEFYERQIDNMKDMNIYLRYKLKLLLKDFSKNNTTNNINQDMQKTDMKLEEENVEQKNKTQVDYPKYDNRSDLLITELNEPMNNNLENVEEKKFTDDQINKVNQRLNYTIQKLYYEIENEKIEYSNLKEVFNKLYVKTNNIYFNILKNTYYEQKANNNNPSGNNSSSISNNNQSTLPSIYQSTSSSRKNQSTTEDGSRYIRKGEGFMDKMKNKEIIIKFLENESIKKIIYKMLYED